MLEQSKYLGVLLYAVQDGDEQEAKVGAWEMPLESAPRFAPMDGPTCDGKALVQTSALAKRYLERFWFRAPAAGTGSPCVRRVITTRQPTLWLCRASVQAAASRAVQWADVTWPHTYSPWRVA